MKVAITSIFRMWRTQIHTVLRKVQPLLFYRLIAGKYAARDERSFLQEIKICLLFLFLLECLLLLQGLMFRGSGLDSHIDVIKWSKGGKPKKQKIFPVVVIGELQ